jgi:poly(3-hydroxybutyrate) depolymerase
MQEFSMSLAFANPAYLWYEAAHWMLTPARAAKRGMKLIFEHRCNPVASTAYARTIAAACQLFETTTRSYDKPAFRTCDHTP